MPLLSAGRICTYDRGTNVPRTGYGKPSRRRAGGPPQAPRPHVPTRIEFAAEFAELGGNVRALARRYQRDRRQIQRWIQAYELRQG